jgi:DNA-binding SARP family transcriptional activator
VDNLRLCLFGSPRIEYRGQPIKIERRKSMALAAYLACAEHRQSRERLADLLWPALDRDHARSALRSALLALTTTIPVSWIDADRTTLALHAGMAWIDVPAFLQLLVETDKHGHGPAAVCDRCVSNVEQAVALYQSGFMTDFDVSDSTEFSAWQASQREWLRREYAEVLHRLSVYYAERLQFVRAIKYAQTWVSSDPLHEPAHRHLMQLYAANGQRTEALRQYARCVDVLDSELATPPDEETTRLYESIQHSSSAGFQAATSIVTTSVLPPLPPLVIGRDGSLKEIKRRLGIGGQAARPFTVIQGWPGVGKSSIVAALAHDREIAKEYPDGILWASLGENPSVLSQLAMWAEALSVGERGKASTIEEVRAQLIAALRDKSVLLVVDDVWQVDHITPFRVGGRTCSSIFTTRLNDVALAIAPTASDIYRLPVLTNHAALELLARLAPEATSEHPDESEALVHNLEGLPLAITVAGRLLHSEARLGWGVKDLLAELETGDRLLDANVPSDMLGAAPEITPTVTTLLRRSTDLLDAQSRVHFAHLGLFVPKPATFDLEAMAAAWNVEDARPGARILVNRGLLEPAGHGRFQIHALLVLHARSLLEEDVRA